MTVLPPANIPPDGGWGWVVMFISFVDNLFIGGITKSSGVLYVAVSNELPITRTQAATIISMAFSISCLLGPLSSSLSTRFTHRVVIFSGMILASLGVAMAAFTPTLVGLIVFYGILMGFGVGLVLLPNMIIVHLYFHRHRTFAAAFALAGGSVGGFAIPPLIEWIITEYGLFETLLAISAIFLQLSPFTMLMRPVKVSKTSRKTAAHQQEVNGLENSKTENTNQEVDVKNPESTEIEAFLDPKVPLKKSYESIPSASCGQHLVQRFLSAMSFDPTILREKYFYMVCFSSACFSFSWLGYLTILPDYAATEGSEPITKSMAVLLLSFMSIGDLVFRIVGGWVMDLKWVNRRYAYPFFLMNSSALLFGYTFPQSYAQYIVSSVLTGICVSGVIILPQVLLNDLIGTKRFPMAYSVAAFISGCAIFVSGPTMASIRERTGSYKFCTLLMSTCVFSAALCWTIDALVVHFRKNRQQNSRFLETKGVP